MCCVDMPASSHSCRTIARRRSSRQARMVESSAAPRDANAIRDTTSSPKTVCGFMSETTPISSPEARCISAPTRVVVPMSKASPYASSTVLPGSKSSKEVPRTVKVPENAHSRRCFPRNCRTPAGASRTTGPAVSAARARSTRMRSGRSSVNVGGGRVRNCLRISASARRLFPVLLVVWI